VKDVCAHALSDRERRRVFDDYNFNFNISNLSSRPIANMVRFDCPAYNGFIQYLCKIAKPRGGAKYIERPQIRSTGENAFDLRAGKLIKNLFGQLVKVSIQSS
jgi:hypothetical protein